MHHSILIEAQHSTCGENAIQLVISYYPYGYHFTESVYLIQSSSTLPLYCIRPTSLYSWCHLPQTGWSTLCYSQRTHRPNKNARRSHESIVRATDIAKKYEQWKKFGAISFSTANRNIISVRWRRAHEHCVPTVYHWNELPINKPHVHGLYNNVANSRTIYVMWTAIKKIAHKMKGTRVPKLLSK